MQASKGQKLSHDDDEMLPTINLFQKSILMFDLMIYTFNMFTLEA